MTYFKENITGIVFECDGEIFTIAGVEGDLALLKCPHGGIEKDDLDVTLELLNDGSYKIISTPDYDIF